jgi:hypothetical protein
MTFRYETDASAARRDALHGPPEPDPAIVMGSIISSEEWEALWPGEDARAAAEEILNSPEGMTPVSSPR